MTILWRYDDRRWLTVDRAFAIFFAIFFLYAVLDWRGFLGTPSWQPLRLVFVVGALLLQSVARLVRTRSRALFYALLAASMVALTFVFIGR